MSGDKIAYSPTEAADLCGLKIDTIRSAYRSGRLEATYVGSRVVIRRQALEQWLDSLPSERAAAS